MNFDLTNLTGQGVSVTAILLAWIGVLSPLMAFLATCAALVYYCVSIYSSKAAQAWLKNRRRRKMHRLQAEVERLKRLAHSEDNAEEP